MRVLAATIGWSRFGDAIEENDLCTVITKSGGIMNVEGSLLPNDWISKCERPLVL